MPNLQKTLIINADDYGYSYARNDAINALFEMGAISSASCLVNTEFFSTPSVPLGLHLNLTEGKPLLSTHRMLVNAKGEFWGKEIFQKTSELMDQNEIQMEIRAQLQRFRKLTNMNPTHIDGHQHVGVFPWVAKCIIKECLNFDITRTRIVIEDLPLNLQMDQKRRSRYENYYKQSLISKKLYEDAGFEMPDAFIGLMSMGSAMNEEIFEQYRAKIKEHEVTEWMVHPGFPSEEGGCGTPPDNFARSKDRLHEYNFLLRLAIQGRLDEFRLVSYSCAFSGN